MAKITDAATNFIREIFGRERQKKDLSVSTRELLQRSSQGRYPGMDMGGFGGLDEYLGLDRRLLYRYSDYEEMDEYADISSALDIFSDDSTQTDSSTRKSVWVESNDEEIKKDLENMFYKRLGIEEEIWGMARGLSKYGNEYQEIVVSEEGVVDIIYLPPATMRRVENEKTDLLGFVQTFEGDIQIDPKVFEKMVLEQGRGINSTGNMAVFEDWRVAHMRLRSKNRDSFYGWPVIESARWVWRRLLLLEDAVMVFKLTRSPSRYAFYIDVGNLPRPQAEREMQEVMNRVKKKKFVNPKTGKLDLRFSPLSFDEDFFLAVRDGKESTRVDVLNGPAYQQVEDVQYFLSKLYAALKVPKAYLGYDESLTSRATLSAEDVRFAKSILRIQRELRNGLKKVANVHLAARKIDPSSVNFEVAMTVPSAIFELGQMEIRRTRAEVAGMMQAHVSLQWILSKVYGLSDQEIEQIIKERKKEMASMPQGQEGGGGGFESKAISGPSITERELMHGRKEDEKRVEAKLMKLLEQRDSRLGEQMRQTGALIREILDSIRAQKR